MISLLRSMMYPIDRTARLPQAALTEFTTIPSAVTWEGRVSPFRCVTWVHSLALQSETAPQDPLVGHQEVAAAAGDRTT